MLKRLLIGAALIGSLSAEGVYINSPLAWGTLRSDSLGIQLLTDSTITGKSITLKVEKQNNTLKSAATIISKKIIMDSKNKTISVKLPSQASGKDYYKVSVYDGKTSLATLAPISYKKVDDKLQNIITATNNSDKDKTQSISLTNSEVKVNWNNTSLFISGKGTGKTTILLDPANSKQGFLTFSNRYISIDFDNKTISFNYFKRGIKDLKVLYELKTWSGKMKSSMGDETSIEIPWYELGIKIFSGRTIGFAAYDDNTSFPTDLERYTPASWGNLTFK